MNGAQIPLAEGLNPLTAGLILVCAFGMVATRQVLGCVAVLYLAVCLSGAISFFDRVQPPLDSSLGPGRYHHRGESHCHPMGS